MPIHDTAGHFFGFLVSPKQFMISIRRQISFLKSALETFLGKIGNNGSGCMANPYKRNCLYFKQC
jgi:hypothetical protein